MNARQEWQHHRDCKRTWAGGASDTTRKTTDVRTQDQRTEQVKDAAEFVDSIVKQGTILKP